MKKAVVYLHGKGGNAAEAAHYRPLFPEHEVFGFDYTAAAPWEAAAEFPPYFDALCREYGPVTLIANSIGAYFALHALGAGQVETAYLISPVTDMGALILGMMRQAGVTEEALQKRGVIPTDFGEPLSWDYLCWVRTHPVTWDVPTHILYGEHDALVAPETVRAFAEKVGASLTVMPGGEHWFHTPEQMAFLDGWLRRCRQG